MGTFERLVLRGILMIINILMNDTRTENVWTVEDYKCAIESAINNPCQGGWS